MSGGLAVSSEDVELVQRGDETARERVLAASQGALLRVASRCVGREVTLHDDEYSIALLAMDEALRTYVGCRGASFSTFAFTVIRRRLLDHLRREYRTGRSLAVSDDIEDTEVGQTEVDEAREARRWELLELQGALRAAGLDFRDIARSVPRRQDVKFKLVHAARLLVTHADLARAFSESFRVPLAELAQLSGVHPKTLERGRKYVVLVALVLLGDYPELQSFVRPLIGGGGA